MRSDAADASTFSPFVAKCEVIVDCAADYVSPMALPEACRKAILDTQTGSDKKMYIYTSGCLVHGHCDEPVTESSPIVEHEPAAWRVALERKLLATTEFETCVLRPAFVYGGTGGFMGPKLFKPALEDGKVVVSGKADKRWSWVHIDDLAEAYVLTIANRDRAAGRVFDIGESHGPTYEELVVACARQSGWSGDEAHRVPAEGFDAFMDITTLVNSKRARDLLGWVPRHNGILADLPIYYESCKAAHGDW